MQGPAALGQERASSCDLVLSLMQLCMLQSLEDTQGKDLLFWANRYHLFVSWSPDRSHPWDSMPAASQYVTLEIGVKRGTTDKVRSPYTDVHCLLAAQC